MLIFISSTSRCSVNIFERPHGPGLTVALRPWRGAWWGGSGWSLIPEGSEAPAWHTGCGRGLGKPTDRAIFSHLAFMDHPLCAGTQELWGTQRDQQDMVAAPQECGLLGGMGGFHP